MMENTADSACSCEHVRATSRGGTNAGPDSVMWTGDRIAVVGMWVDCDAMTLQRRLRSSRLACAGFNARTVASGHRGDALRHPVLMARFLATTPEVSNWTYDLENADELLALAAGAVGRPAAELLAYGRELETDQRLRQALRDRLAARRDRGSEPQGDAEGRATPPIKR